MFDILAHAHMYKLANFKKPELEVFMTWYIAVEYTWTGKGNALRNKIRHKMSHLIVFKIKKEKILKSKIF